MQKMIWQGFQKYIHRALGLDFSALHQTINAQTESLKLMHGKSLANQVKAHGPYRDVQDAEFKVFSQFGDDGILQYLIHCTNPDSKTFIEFGVENYTESNTRFLLMNDNWSGLIMDGDEIAMKALRSKPLYWRFDLTSVGVFITRENINRLFDENGFRGEIGLLSIDIDGNDYWVWEAINSVIPVIVTVEYNSVFGAEYAITVPYDPEFRRTSAHYSNLYWGASLKALYLLAQKKGYAFVRCNSSGNNAHFVRQDKVGDIPIKTVEQGYVKSKFRESRDRDGKLTFLRGEQRIEAIKDMQVVDVENNRQVYLRDLFHI